MPGHRAGIIAIRELGHGYVRRVTVLDKRREALRNVGINPKRRQRSQRDDWRISCSRRWRGRLWDQGARIDIARSDDAVVRSAYYFILLHSEFLFVNRFGLQHRGMRSIGGLLRNNFL